VEGETRREREERERKEKIEVSFDVPSWSDLRRGMDRSGDRSRLS